MWDPLHLIIYFQWKPWNGPRNLPDGSHPHYFSINIAAFKNKLHFLQSKPSVWSVQNTIMPSIIIKKCFSTHFERFSLCFWFTKSIPYRQAVQQLNFKALRGVCLRKDTQQSRYPSWHDPVALVSTLKQNLNFAWKSLQAWNRLVSLYFLLDASGYFWRLNGRTVPVGDTRETFYNQHCSEALLSRSELANSQHQRRYRVLCQDNELGLLFSSEWKTTLLTQKSDIRPHLVTPQLPSCWDYNGAFLWSC